MEESSTWLRWQSTRLRHCWRIFFVLRSSWILWLLSRSPSQSLSFTLSSRFAELFIRYVNDVVVVVVVVLMMHLSARWMKRRVNRIEYNCTIQILLTNSLRYYSIVVDSIRKMWHGRRETETLCFHNSRAHFCPEERAIVARARICVARRIIKCLRFSNDNWMSGKLIKSTINLSFTWTHRCEMIQVMTLLATTALRSSFPFLL